MDHTCQGARLPQAVVRLGWVYRTGAPQMAHLAFSGADDVVVVDVTDSYHLVFHKDGTAFRLVQLDQRLTSDL
jgi:hypothetical protein